MQCNARYFLGLSVRLAVYLSVFLSNACIVTKLALKVKGQGQISLLLFDL